MTERQYRWNWALGCLALSSVLLLAVWLSYGPAVFQERDVMFFALIPVPFGIFQAVCAWRTSRDLVHVPVLQVVENDHAGDQRPDELWTQHLIAEQRSRFTQRDVETMADEIEAEDK